VTKCRNLSLGWRLAGIVSEVLCGSRPMYAEKRNSTAKRPVFGDDGLEKVDEI
jgi:hypothetical protein